jgi:ATP-dependent Clp protease ATP-binding subunit ClpB
MRERSILLKWDSNISKSLGEQWYDPRYGARPLKRLIQQKITNMLSIALLEGAIFNDSVVRLISKGQLFSYQVEKDSIERSRNLVVS